jgi:hypothetical protein
MLRALARILPLWIPAVGLAILAVPDAPAAPPSYQPDPELGVRPFVECPGLAVHVARWQRALRLEHWEVTTHCGMPATAGIETKGHVRFEIRGLRSRHAQIWILPGMGKYQEQIVVHELAHLFAVEHYRFEDEDREEEWVRGFTRSVLRPRVLRLRAERAAREAAVAAESPVAARSFP